MSKQEKLDDLRARFLAAAELVISAATWEETQDRMQHGTYPILVEMKQVEEA